jgi:hypothetical protein
MQGSRRADRIMNYVNHIGDTSRHVCEGRPTSLRFPVASAQLSPVSRHQLIQLLTKPARRRLRVRTASAGGANRSSPQPPLFDVCMRCHLLLASRWALVTSRQDSSADLLLLKGPLHRSMVLPAAASPPQRSGVPAPTLAAFRRVQVRCSRPGLIL